MKFYQEITLLQSEEIGIYFLWEKLFTQLHLGFVKFKGSEDNSSIGISFPEYHSRGLGKKIRLFAEKETLLSFNTELRLDRLSDYIHIKSIKAVPSDVKYYTSFHRFRFKSNKDGLVRRYAKRHKLSLNEASKHYEDFERTDTLLPFIQMKSLSTGEKFKLHIAQSSSKEEVNQGFTCYGLSLTENKSYLAAF
jgi:CRISPR-associated endonuclease Csy4